MRLHSPWIVIHRPLPLPTTPPRIYRNQWFTTGVAGTVSKSLADTLFNDKFQSLLNSVLLTKHHSSHQIKKAEKSRACGTYLGQKWCRQGLGGETLWKETTHFEDLGVSERIILWEDNIKIDLKWDGAAWTGFIWYRTETDDGLLWMRWWTFGFHNIRGIPWVAEGLLASQEGFCSMESVSHSCIVQAVCRWKYKKHVSIWWYIVFPPLRCTRWFKYDRDKL